MGRRRNCVAREWEWGKSSLSNRQCTEQQLNAHIYTYIYMYYTHSLPTRIMGHNIIVQHCSYKHRKNTYGICGNRSPSLHFCDRLTDLPTDRPTPREDQSSLVPRSRSHDQFQSRLFAPKWLLQLHSAPMDESPSSSSSCCSTSHGPSRWCLYLSPGL